MKDLKMFFYIKYNGFLYKKDSERLDLLLYNIIFQIVG